MAMRRGVFSSRKIERATYDSVAFRYIAANTHPDHDTLAKFRKQFLTELEDLFRRARRKHVQHAGDDASPAGLVTGPYACTGLPMEVLVEQDVVAPVLIIPPAVSALGGPASFLVAKEQARQPSCELLADL